MKNSVFSFGEISKRVGIILLTYNNHSITRRCIDSLKTLNYTNFEIYVVDNGSELTFVCQECRVIRSEFNLGFGGGNNLGIREALKDGCESIWLLNNDTIVMPDTLSKLVEFGKERSSSLIGAKLINYPEMSLQAYGGGRISWVFGVAPLNKTNSGIDYLSGASIFYDCRAIALEFDPIFFMYWEDSDLAIRMRNRGYALECCENAIVLHQESSSLGKFSEKLESYYVDSMVKFFRRYSRIWVLPVSIGLSLRIARRILLGEFGSIRTIIRQLNISLNKERL